ncbi:hypothetical protein LA345_36650 (plasmid) [Burkholderia vietnamiensis]|uniref:Uncharacterized protein n=1 Tax=Burkholderia vietnamiensis (strain G4 / LMG 22486) TaxID=269482 RepID=A4JVV1_BURVG|nr:hypothetical protein Bcep1808_7529 [Burkholderia vietnamiensis G4]MCB4349343.1 hypothetical protein [Burkholderia vietnamiensis]
MQEGIDLENHPVVRELDAERDRLQQAGDVIVNDLKARGSALPKDQHDAMKEVLGAVVEYTDTLNLARAGIFASTVHPDDPQLDRLIARSNAVSTSILAAA